MKVVASPCLLEGIGRSVLMVERSLETKSELSMGVLDELLKNSPGSLRD